jgi:hypothetical protein
MFENLVADRVYQVGLAKTSTAIDEQGVVSRFARTDGDAPGGCPREVVGLSDDQVVEGESRDQPGFLVARPVLLNRSRHSRHRTNGNHLPGRGVRSPACRT